MPQDEPDLLLLMGLAIVQKDDAACERLVAILDPILDKIAHAAYRRLGSSAAHEDFRAWLPGYLFLGRNSRIHTVYRALHAEVKIGRAATPAAQNVFLEAYLKRAMAKSAVPDYWKEASSLVRTLQRKWEQAENKPDGAGNRPVPFPRQVPMHQVEDLPAPEPEKPANGEPLQSVLLRLKPMYRVPLVLKHYDVLGPLDASDLAWVADQTDRFDTPQAVQEAIDAEYRANAGKKKPLSAAFISELLGILPSASGKFDVVDKRANRALQDMRRILGPGPGEDGS